MCVASSDVYKYGDAQDAVFRLAFLVANDGPSFESYAWFPVFSDI